MKKVLALTIALLLSLSTLAGCDESGKNNIDSGNSSNHTASSQREVIKASELISKEDAEALLGQDVEIHEDIYEKSFIDQARYNSDDKTLTIELWQEALHNKDSKFEKSLIQNGWSDYVKRMEDAYISYTKADPENPDLVYIELEGTYGTYYLQQITLMGQSLMQIFYGDYMITLYLSNYKSNSHVDSEDEKLWKREKLMEIGDFAIERLKEIIE